MNRATQATAAVRQRGETTRQRLLDEATRQFAQAGYSGTSLAAIARACRLGNAGVLHHFPSKQALYKAVLTRLSELLEHDTEAALAAHDDPAERLRALVRRYIAGAVAHPGAERLILRELLDNSARLPHAKSLPLVPFVTTFCRLIEEAQRAGATPPGPPVVLLTQFLGALAYALVVRPTFACMELGTHLPDDERQWVEAVGAAAERTLLEARADKPTHGSGST